jgi:hypothetical protein
LQTLAIVGGTEVVGQTNVEHDQRHADAEHAIRQGFPPGLWKQEQSPALNAADEGCHVYPGFEGEMKKAAYLCQNIKLFRPFAAFQD